MKNCVAILYTPTVHFKKNYRIEAAAQLAVRKSVAIFSNVFAGSRVVLSTISVRPSYDSVKDVIAVGGSNVESFMKYASVIS